MSRDLRIAYITTEVAPFAKSGQLADVSHSLPKYLSYLGLEVSIFMPLYRTAEIESLPKELVSGELMVPMGDSRVKGRVFRSSLPNHTIYFIDNLKYFWREYIYGTGKGEYLDNDERFVFFNRAVLEYVLRAKMPLDIFHCNNWPTALIPVLLKTHYSKKPPFDRISTVFTIHNIACQGKFPPESLALTGLSWKYFCPSKLSLNGRFNFLKAGLIFSDVLNTVGSSYKKQIMTPKHGQELAPILRNRKDVFYTVRNGVDNEIWNPETDPYIEAHFSSSDFMGKNRCKQDLIREFGLSIGPEAPVAGMFSYLSRQKGLDILLEAVEDILDMGVALVVLGQGDEKYLHQLRRLQKEFKNRLAVKEGMMPSLMHKIAAGADIYLMPSLVEPWGLNHLYCFRYGTVPVVRYTGGLKETVKPFEAKSRSGNGFIFYDYSSQALVQAMRKAVSFYQKPSVWKTIMKNCLQEDYSWTYSAKRYRRLYDKAVEKKRGGKFV
jgi:starch synthase